jgi:hypothetical protein
MTLPLSQALYVDEPYTKVWYTNGGATKHISDKHFINFTSIQEGTWPMAIGSDQHFQVCDCGDIPCYNLFMVFKDMELSKTIGQAENNGVFTTYKPNDCELIAQEGERQLVITGVHNDKLYKLENQGCKVSFICEFGCYHGNFAYMMLVHLRT